MNDLLDIVLNNISNDINTANAIIAITGIAFYIMMFVLGVLIHYFVFPAATNLSLGKQSLLGGIVALIFCPYIESHQLPGFAGASDVVTFIANTGVTILAGTASQEIYTKLVALIVNFPTSLSSPFRSSH